MPIYSRDAELFTGTLEQIRTWMIGVKWARDYDMMLRLSDDKKRVKKEDDYRAKRMLNVLAGEKLDEKVS